MNDEQAKAIDTATYVEERMKKLIDGKGDGDPAVVAFSDYYLLLRDRSELVMLDSDIQKNPDPTQKEKIQRRIRILEVKIANTESRIESAIANPGGTAYRLARSNIAITLNDFSMQSKKTITSESDLLQASVVAMSKPYSQRFTGHVTLLDSPKVFK